MTYRELFDKLGSLNPNMLDSEIRVIPVGYTDADAQVLLRYETIPQVLELARTDRNIYRYTPSEEGDWIVPGLCDFSDDEVAEMGIDQDNDYTLICKKGELIFKIKDGISILREEESKIGNLDTGILHL